MSDTGIVWIDDQLEERAEELRKANPGTVFVVEDRKVWWRENGMDYGVYERDGAGQIVCILFRRPPLKRKAP